MNRQTTVRFESNDYYAYLNLDSAASLADVKRNYRQLALLWHPDKQVGSDRSKANDIFQKIVEAHETLTDADMRKRYDNIWGQRFRGRHRVVPEWARSAGRARSRPCSVDSCASLAGRGLSEERSSVERSINVPSATPQAKTTSKPTVTSIDSPEDQKLDAVERARSKSSIDAAKQSEKVNGEKPRSRPLSPPYLAPKRQRTPSPPRQQKPQPPPSPPTPEIIRASPLGRQAPTKVPPSPTSPPIRQGVTEGGVSQRATFLAQGIRRLSSALPEGSSSRAAEKGKSLRESRRSLAAAAKTSSYVEEREAAFQQQEKENLKREELERKSRDGADFRRQLFEDHRRTSREEDDDCEPPPRVMSKEEIAEQSKAEREAFTGFVAELARTRAKREERERLEQQAEDEMEAAAEKERKKSSAPRSAEVAPRNPSEPRFITKAEAKTASRPKEIKSMQINKAGTVTDGRWKCAECVHLNPVTKMRCEVCDGVWQASAPVGNPESSVHEGPDRHEPSAGVRKFEAAKVGAARSPPNNAKEHADVSANASLAGVVGGGVAGLAGYTAQSVQEGWTAAITTLFSPFIRNATRPEGPEPEWLCGRCGRTLRGRGSNLCDQCGAIQEDHYI